MNIKNKVIIGISIIFVILILISIFGIIIYSKDNVQIGLKVKDKIKPPLTVDIKKEDVIVGQTIGAISSWKYNGSIATSSLVTARVILEKENSLVNVKAGDMLRLSIENFDISLLENIYEITYNAMDDEENYILPIDEVIDFSSKVIEIPILRENLDKILYYHVTIKIKDKGSVVYFFKVMP